MIRDLIGTILGLLGVILFTAAAWYEFDRGCHFAVAWFSSMVVICGFLVCVGGTRLVLGDD